MANRYERFVGSLLVIGLALATCAKGQAPESAALKALKYAAVGSLWVDYCQVRYGQERGTDTWLFVRKPPLKFTPTSIAVVNAAEVALNLWAPRKIRPWLNAATLAFHVVSIRNIARRPVGVLTRRDGQAEILRIGVRLTPW